MSPARDGYLWELWWPGIDRPPTPEARAARRAETIARHRARAMREYPDVWSEPEGELNPWTRAGRCCSTHEDSRGRWLCDRPTGHAGGHIGFLRWPAKSEGP